MTRAAPLLATLVAAVLLAPGAPGPALYYLVNIPNPSLFCALEIEDF